ncbi:hypothetical protein ABRP72_19625 [Pectobacterium carotovorum]|uniref:hypothetical protein n=1 Tax=Pectobacterium carotovorum TaxID=554 RepID=UPI0032EF62D4
MTNKGIESSVIDTFVEMLKDSCRERNEDDLSFSLNGGDRLVNADNMFSVCNRFFLVEMKSWKNNISDEDRKPSAHRLCLGLSLNSEIRPWHRQCHYIMWGAINASTATLTPVYSIYEDIVCQPATLPGCQALSTPVNPQTAYGTDLINATLTNTAGLTSPEFFHYLEWLLGPRSGPFTPTAAFMTEPSPIALIGSSSNQRVYGQIFGNFGQLALWGDDPLRKKLQPKRPYRP